MSEPRTRSARRARLTPVKSGDETGGEPAERIFAVTPDPALSNAPRTANDDGRGSRSFAPIAAPPLEIPSAPSSAGLKTLQTAQAEARAAGYEPSADWLLDDSRKGLRPATLVGWAVVAGAIALILYFLAARA
jgi:hypothetical protein